MTAKIRLKVHCIELFEGILPFFNILTKEILEI